MSASLARDGHGLTVILDIRHPSAYLALQPTIDLARETNTRVHWLPMAFRTMRPPSSPTPDDDRGTRHTRRRALMVSREIAIYAEAQGLHIQAFYRDAPATAVHQAWLWVQQAAPDALESFLEEAFRRYWAEDLDASSLDDVSEVVTHCGLDAQSFRGDAELRGTAADEGLIEQLRDAGIFQAPAFLVEEETFYGRQHLPMIRWILEGRRGRGPI